MRTVTDADRDIGQRIQAARRQRGITLRKLAEALTVSVQQMQKYEAGLNRISAANLAIVASLLRVDLRELAAADAAPGIFNAASQRALALADLFDRVPEEAMREAIFRLVETAAADGDRAPSWINIEPAKAG